MEGGRDWAFLCYSLLSCDSLVLLMVFLFSIVLSDSISRPLSDNFGLE